jgi:hypothetical protein
MNNQVFNLAMKNPLIIFPPFLIKTELSRFNSKNCRCKVSIFGTCKVVFLRKTTYIGMQNFLKTSIKQDDRA